MRAEAECQDALQTYGITEGDLTRRLLWQVDVVALYRLPLPPRNPDPHRRCASILSTASFQLGTKGRSSRSLRLEESRDQIEEILTQKRIDQALDQWIKETEARFRSRISIPSLRQ